MLSELKCKKKQPNENAKTKKEEIQPLQRIQL